MAASPRRTALTIGILVFIGAFLLSLLALGYDPQQAVVASISPAIGAAIGVYLANRFIVGRD